MRKSTSVHPLVQGKCSEPGSDTRGTKEELPISTPNVEGKAQIAEGKQPAPSFRSQSILSRILASRHNSNAAQGRRVESEVATAGLEESFDPSQVPPRHRSSLSGQKMLELPSPGGTTHSQERNGRLFSTHTRVSSVDSIEPLASEIIIKSQEWAADVTLNSEHNYDGLRPIEQLSAQSTARPLFPSPSSVYNIQQIANSSEARKELIALNPAQRVVSMALTAPDKYPLLDLSEEGLEDGDVWKIVRLTEVYPFATGLDLYGNDITLGKKAVLPIGSEHREIRKLSLRKCPLSQAGTESRLGTFLRVFVGLELLDLRECDLGDEDIARISPDLSSLSSLKVLLLNHNSFTNTGVLSLIPILERCPDLSQVDLRQTKVTGGIRRVLGSHKKKIVLEEGWKCCNRCCLL